MKAIIKNIIRQENENFLSGWFKIEDSTYKDEIEFTLTTPHRTNEKKKIIYGKKYSALLIKFYHTTKAQNTNQFDDCRGLNFDDKTFKEMIKAPGYENFRFKYGSSIILNDGYYDFNEINILKAINFITETYYNTTFNKLQFIE